MKILFVWTGVTSYMADCWRRLQQEPDIELKVVVEQVTSGREFDAEKVLAGLDYQLVPNGDPSSLCASALKQKPDLVFACGWHSTVVRTLVARPDWKDVPKVCCSDMPWRWKFRCFAARFVLRRYLRQFAGMMVPGRSGHRYARWLGFSEERIFEGMYGIDVERLGTAERVERSGFLYLGRFAPEKRLDVLLKAYLRYRRLGGTWALDLYGAGPLEDGLRQSIARSGVQTIGLHPFVQPADVSLLYASHACLTLTSDFDPWPLVVLESCANGLPVIVTDQCTNHYEFVRRNGLVVRRGDVEGFARALLRMERERTDFDVAEGRRRAADYSCAAWCGKIRRIAERLKGGT